MINMEPLKRAFFRWKRMNNATCLVYGKLSMKNVKRDFNIKKIRRMQVFNKILQKHLDKLSESSQKLCNFFIESYNKQLDMSQRKENQ